MKLANRSIIPSCVITAVCSLAMSANATIITFGGVTPTDGSMQTAGGDSRLSNIQWITDTGTPTSDITNIIHPNSGFFVETFDAATANPLLSGANPSLLPSDPSLPSWLEFTTDSSDDCAVNSGNALEVSGLPVGAGLGVQNGNTGKAAHNDANSTCFAYAPQLGESANATITIDYAEFFQGQSIGYVGLYYGSVDWYNSLSFGNFVDDVFVAIELPEFGSELDGIEILDKFELQSGNRTSSNKFVNLFFEPDEIFTALRFINSHTRAFEVDNIVVGTRSSVDVSEPSLLFLFGISVIGLGLRSQRKRK